MFDHFTNVHAVFTQLVVFVTCYSSGCVGSCANFLKLRNTQVWVAFNTVANPGVLTVHLENLASDRVGAVWASCCDATQNLSSIEYDKDNPAAVDIDVWPLCATCPPQRSMDAAHGALETCPAVLPAHVPPRQS